MTTSVLIPAYNGSQFLPANLPAVLGLGADEVIVVNDASTDDTLQILQKFPVKIINHPKNTGFPVSVNDGFKRVSGEVVVLLNQDVMPDKTLIKKLLPRFHDPKVFAVTFNERNRSWAKAEIKNGFLQFSNGEPDGQTHDSFWASGGSAAFRKSIWDTLGGFDPVFSPGYFEDLDLGWRAHTAGYKIIWDPDCVVAHVSPQSTFDKTFSPKSLQRIKDRNYLLAHWKNLDPKDLPAHIASLISRTVRHPGFLAPLLMALQKYIF
jgi:GT2 family glycosyltransferase